MATYEHVQIEQAGAVLTVRIHRPDARNALSTGVLRELEAVARELRQRSDVHAIILTGAADYFSAGADLAERSGAKPTLLERRQIVSAGPDMCKAWAEIEPITIAAIEGYCIGGGAALVACCDFRVAGHGAYLRLPEVPLGINMSWRSIPRLTAMMGPSRAKRFVMFGEKLDAETAEEWGLVDEVTTAGGAYEAAQRWAAKVAALPPLPVRMTKEAVDAATHLNDPTPTFMDRDQYLLTALTDDFKEGVQAFFEKRDPDFKGD